MDQRRVSHINLNEKQFQYSKQRENEEFKLEQQRLKMELLKKKKWYKILLCCDPDSHQIYTYNIQSRAIHIEQNVPLKYRAKMEQEIKNIQNLLQLPKSQWNLCTYQTWAYRRRTLNNYLIRGMVNIEPTYLAQSPMSDAFANVQSFQVMVDISEYVRIDENQLDQSYAGFVSMNPLSLEFDVDLVTCADEVVRKVLKEIYSVLGVKIRPRESENKFILQISGLREYLSGNYPMLSYDRVRATLRGLQWLKVQLTEVAKQSAQRFPPIFEREHDDIVRGIYHTPWEQFMDVPILLYYPPYPLMAYNQVYQRTISMKSNNNAQQSFGGNADLDHQSFSQLQNNNKFNQDMIQSFVFDEHRGSFSMMRKLQSNHRPSIIKSDQFLTLNQYRQQSIPYTENEKLLREQQLYSAKSFIPLRPRLLIKEKAVEFNQDRYKMIENGNININNYMLYSGECDFPFRVNIVGITNIYRLLELDNKCNPELEEVPERRATYNGLCPPRYITKKSAQQEEQHNTSKQKVKIEEDPNQKKKPFIKFTKMNNKKVEKVLLTPHINHGQSGNCDLQNIAQQYELDITPYLVQVEVSLLYGQILLTKYTTNETRLVPFRAMPRWDQSIQFSGLKVSQLPMEVRLCMNIIIKSEQNQSQVIGCIVLDVFDANGIIRQGRITQNIWPFYKFDNRLACMGEYNGLPLKDFINSDSYYSKIIISFDQFDAPMQWSLRNHLNMAKLGFHKSPKSRDQLKFSQRSQNEQSEQQYNPKSKTFQSTYDRQPEWRDIPTINELARLQELLVTDSLNRVNFTDEDKFIIMKCRSHYKSMGKYFSVFLTSIDWSDPEQIAEVYLLMKQWDPLHPNEALPLLDAIISDETVRYYATQRVAIYKDDELVLYMLELTQAIMFEQQHFSPLGEMLLERAIMNPWVVGHELFWQLRSQLHIQPTFERYSLILESLMMLCGYYRDELLKEVYLNDQVMEIANKVKRPNIPKSEILKQLREDLVKCKNDQDKYFQFAIDPRMACKGFIENKCRILDSKKLPLWLRMKGYREELTTSSQIKLIQLSEIQNIDKLQIIKQKIEAYKNMKSNDEFIIIYKCGDDIRQDLLTLQLIKIMDKIWLDAGEDLRMKPYRVISTLDQVGMIEVVLDSDTISEIHRQAGTLGALQKDSISQYLLTHNSNKDNMNMVLDNFVRSCAGYCVATYVLGIGDRHSGNIMITKVGHFFHIDFGHFLGNFKTKFGFQRERSPFVFTQEMAYVIEQSQFKFKVFQEMCCKAYNQVRKHGNFLINIFLMMLSAGMPELQELSDIDYLKNQLSLELSEQEASEKFIKEIEGSLQDNWRSIDNFIHNIKRT